MSASDLAAVHTDIHHVRDGNGDYYPTQAGVELRAGPLDGPRSLIERCAPANAQFVYALAGSTLAYSSSNCRRGSRPTVIIRDLAAGKVERTFVQPVDIQSVSSIRLAGPFVGWITKPVFPPVRVEPAEIVVMDLRTGRQVLELPFVDSGPGTFALQADGKIAFTSPLGLGWASPSGAPGGRFGVITPFSARPPAPHLLPGVPNGYVPGGGLVIAGNRIAFTQATHDACTNASGLNYNLVVSDLAGHMATIGPAGFAGGISQNGFDGTNITWSNFTYVGGQAPTIELQNLASEPPTPIANPPRCPRLVPALARLSLPHGGEVTAAGRLRVRLRCLQPGTRQTLDDCEGDLFLSRPGRSACTFPQPVGPPARALLGTVPNSELALGDYGLDTVSLPITETQSLSIDLTKAALRRVRAGSPLYAVLDWCDPAAPFITKPIARLHLTLHNGP